MAAPLKNQTRKIFVRSTNQSKHMSTSRIKCSVAYDSYIYGEHAFPIISVTHTRCGKDPIDIPKESKDPTTSRVRQRKIKMSRNTSPELQGSTISGDDNANSTILAMVIKVIIPATDKEMP